MAIDPSRTGGNPPRNFGAMVPFEPSQHALSDQLALQEAISTFSVGGGTDKTIADIVKLFLKYWKLASSIAVVFVVGAGVYCATATRKYTASATIHIGSYAPVIPGAEVENMFRQQSMEQGYLNTQIASLSSLNVADQVVSDPDVGPKVKSYLGGGGSFLGKLMGRSGVPEEIVTEGEYKNSVNLLKKYAKLIVVEPVRETSLVKVSAETSNPELSRLIANSHSQQFISFLRSDRQKTVLDNLNFLQEQAKDLEKRVAEAESKVAAYAEQNGLFALAKDAELVTKQIGTLSEDRAKAMSERIKAETLLSEVKGKSGVESTILDDESIRNLRTTLKQAEAEYANMRTKFTAEFPQVGQLKARIDALKETIVQQRSQAIRGLEAQYRSALATEQKIEEQITKQKTVDHQTSGRLVEYNALQREYDSLKDLHQTVLRQLKEMQLSAAGKSTNISISEYAVAPIEPSSPKVGAILVLAAAFGLVAGVGIALLKETLDTTLKSSDDASTMLRVPTLGVVPDFDQQTPQSESAEKRRRLLERSVKATSTELVPSVPVSTLEGIGGLVTIAVPHGAAAEAFRSIRTSILLSSADYPPKIVMVTSPRKGEGKTTVASNLAVSLAQAGHRTLIIDTDIRQPKLRERFNLSGSRLGLVDFLAHQAVLEGIIFPTDVPNLSVMPAGSSAPNPAELVGSKRMAELLRTLAGTYDHIIIDTPPILTFADALMMGRSVNGVIVVTRSNVTERSYAQDAIRRLRNIRAPILGLVMNGVPLDRSKSSPYSDYANGAYVVPEVRRAG